MSDQAVKFRVNEAGIPRYMHEHARFCFWRLITKDNGDTKDGTVTGPASQELIEALEAKGFTSKNEEGENEHE